MGSSNSKATSKSKQPTGRSPDADVEPSLSPTRGPADTNSRSYQLYRQSQYNKNKPWAVLNQGPSKRDGVEQRKRDQAELEKLVREAKFGPDARLIDASVKPQTLSSRSLAAIAEYVLQEGQSRKIVILAGAGISTSAGLPDFRTPGTGLYSNLAKLNLPTPEAVFDIGFFRKNPKPFYFLHKELMPGKYKPTITHAFFALLYKKKMLKMLFTQNIDCLELQAGIPADLIVNAHGSFATASCIDCKYEFPHELMKEKIERDEIPKCLQAECNGLIKPDIIMFGEQLPRRFHEKCAEIPTADLVIVMGSSLTVAPFSSLPGMALEGIPRVLFNMNRVGDLGTRADDVIVLGDCDSNVRKMAEALGWSNELEELWLECRGEKRIETTRDIPLEGVLWADTP